MYKPINECKTVKELLEDPARWCQGNIAEDAQGETTTPNDPAAVRFCLIGACEKIYGKFESIDPRGEVLYPAIKKRSKDGVSDGIVQFNDSSTHPELMDLLQEVGI